MTEELRNRFRLKIRTTAEQRQLLKDIQRTLAEQSYLIFTVAPWYRRNPHDYIAIKRNNPQQMLLIRPAKNGIVEICHYLIVLSYYPEWVKLIDHKRKSGKVQFRKLFPKNHQKKQWATYIHSRHTLELQLFAFNPLHH